MVPIRPILWSIDYGPGEIAWTGQLSHLEFHNKNALFAEGLYNCVTGIDTDEGRNWTSIAQITLSVEPQFYVNLVLSLLRKCEKRLRRNILIRDFSDGLV
jgi:hypothetical protein